MFGWKLIRTKKLIEISNQGKKAMEDFRSNLREHITLYDITKAIVRARDDNENIEKIVFGNKEWNEFNSIIDEQYRVIRQPSDIFIYNGKPVEKDDNIIGWYLKLKGGERNMTNREVTFKARVAEINRSRIIFEFGRSQVNMDISGSGSAARKLKLKKGTKVSVSLKALGK